MGWPGISCFLKKLFRHLQRTALRVCALTTLSLAQGYGWLRGLVPVGAETLQLSGAVAVLDMGTHRHGTQLAREPEGAAAPLAHSLGPYF